MARKQRGSDSIKQTNYMLRTLRRALKVACPTCKAPKGEWCRDPTGIRPEHNLPPCEARMALALLLED